jgi:hypothetical protein
MNQAVSDRIAVVGSAGAPAFQSYVLEYRLMSGGGRGITVRQVRGSLPVFDDQLDEWDTTRAPNGTYEIHLTVISASGARPQTYTVATVENP